MKIKSYAIIGDPIDHSLSPTLHNYWFKKYNIKSSYSLYKVDDENLKKVIDKIRSKELSGINVTLPFKQKIIKSRMNNNSMQISHQNLKTGTLIKITNPKNNKSIVLKNIKRIRYPEFYKVLITKPVAEKLNLTTNIPILDIIEIRKNKLQSW